LWRNQNGRPKPSSGSGSGWSELDLAALEGELFLLGHWKNYEDLEENLSMPELINTFKAIQKTEDEKRRFLASIQGVDLKGEDEETKKGPTFEDIRRKALGIKANAEDVVSLQGPLAREAGFGIGAGLGYTRSN